MIRRFVGTGVLAALAAMAATTAAAALARAVGVDFEVPDGGETIPLPGVAVMTGFFSVVGIVIAGGLLRWAARPAERFVQTAMSLTAISLVAPLISRADAATIAALLGLHLVAAAVMIPALARSLRRASGERKDDQDRSREAAMAAPTDELSRHAKSSLHHDYEGRSDDRAQPGPRPASDRRAHPTPGGVSRRS